MRTMLLCFFIAAATNGQAHEVDNIDYELLTDGTAWVKNGKKAQGDGAQVLNGEGLICNEAPDDDVQAACRKLGADLAAW